MRLQIKGDGLEITFLGDTDKIYEKVMKMGL